MKKWILILTLIGSSMIFAGYRTDMISKMEAKEKRITSNYYEQGPTGEAQMMDEVQNAWDNELNKVYKLLMSKLSSTQKTKLRNEERAWIKKREKSIDMIASEMNGCMGAAVTIVNSEIDTIKSRAIKLARRYDGL